MNTFTYITFHTCDRWILRIITPHSAELCFLATLFLLYSNEPWWIQYAYCHDMHIVSGKKDEIHIAAFFEENMVYRRLSSWIRTMKMIYLRKCTCIEHKSSPVYTKWQVVCSSTYSSEIQCWVWEQVEVGGHVGSREIARAQHDVLRGLQSIPFFHTIGSFLENTTGYFLEKSSWSRTIK